MGKILIVDDDHNICRILFNFLKGEGLDPVFVHDVDSAIPFLRGGNLDLVISDLKLPGKDGICLLRSAQEIACSIPVIIITAYGDIQGAVMAMKLGAYDFIAKPFDETNLLITIRKALSESVGNRKLLSAYFDSKEFPLGEIIGNSSAITEVLQTIRKIAFADPAVLITGETGVGKELIARALHTSGHRRGKPFVKINCAAIPENLLESELFGYEKGAFTGAAMSKPGRFEVADTGTVFLDEVGEMPFHLQAKLLSAIQDQCFERVGGVKSIKVNIRIIAATNRNLQTEVEYGRFRADLFYRLKVVQIQVPPLRDRKGDIFTLANHFVKRFSSKYGKDVTGFLPEVMGVFTSYGWPGNIRELENVVERMVLMSDEEVLGRESLPKEMLYYESKTVSEPKNPLDIASCAVEKQIIAEALSKTDKNRTKAAKLLGISRRTLQYKIKKYDLK